MKEEKMAAVRLVDVAGAHDAKSNLTVLKFTGADQTSFATFVDAEGANKLIGSLLRILGQAPDNLVQPSMAAQAQEIRPSDVLWGMDPSQKETVLGLQVGPVRLAFRIERSKAAEMLSFLRPN
jgi:hypothetical protein